VTGDKAVLVARWRAWSREETVTVVGKKN
jgi:hypothetical protein